MHSDLPSAEDILIKAAIATLAVPSVMISHRLISAGDEYALMPEEAASFGTSFAKVKRASGSARMVARELLAHLGFEDRAVSKATSGAPIWPDGVVGSISHDSRIAIVAVALSRDVAALGIDIEPAEFLPPDLLEYIATSRELRRIADDPFGGRLLFVAKEAVYKAVYPLDHEFLEHQDVEIDLASGRGQVRNGRIIDLRFSVSSRLIAVGFI